MERRKIRFKSIIFTRENKNLIFNLCHLSFMDACLKFKITFKSLLKVILNFKS